MKHFSNLMQRFLLVMLALCASVSVDAYDFEAAHFSKSWPLVNECSLQQEEESGYCGNPDVNEGKNLCYVVTSENDVKTLTISRNPDAVGNDFGIAENFFCYKDFSVLVIEDGVTSIGQGAFWGCENLTTVTFPDGLTSIGQDAFMDCTSLTTVTFPDGLTSIEQAAFRGCTSLTTVTFPDGLASIGQAAFMGCTSLTTVIFPDGLTSIGEGAFYNCSNLTTVTFPEGLTSIGQSAFFFCKNLTTLTFPSSLTSIGEGAFGACWGVTDIYCHADPSKLTWIDEGCDDFMADKATLCHVFNKSEWSSFEGNVNVTFVGEIDGYCGNPDVNEGKNLCYVVTSENDVKTLTISRNPDAVGNDFGIAENFFCYKDFSVLVIEDGVTSIGEGAFYECENLTTVTFPEGLTSIGQDAFNGCESLKTLTFPEGLASIGQGAFYWCTNLTTVTFPEGLTSIGQDAFMGCTNLTTVTFHDGLASIGESAFWNCTSLTTVTLPDGLTSIGQAAFYGCGSLTTLTFPSSLASIGEGAFGACRGVTDIYCHASPAQLSWIDERCDDFKADKATLCHVYDEGDWSVFEGVVNVTFVGDLPVVLEKNGDNSDLVAFPPTKAKDVTLADRVLFADGSWNTLCLPFSLSSLDGTPLEGFTVKELDTQTDVGGHRTGMEGETLYLNFKDVTSIEAGKPYLVKKTKMVSDISYISCSATKGTKAASGLPDATFDYKGLVDGKTGRRWRTNPPPSNASNFCEFEASEPVCVTRYEIFATNLNYKSNPTVWTLKGKLNEEDDWTVIDSRDTGANPGDSLGIATSKKNYNIANDKQGVFKYFRFDVTKINGGRAMVISELMLYGAKAEITSIENPVFTGVTIQNVAPTVVSSDDGKVSFAGSYKPIGGSSQLNLGTGNRLFHLSGGKKMGALHAAFFTGQVNSAGNPVGDVNSDGTVDISDVVVLVNKILNDSSDVSDVTDVNGDGTVDISDVVLLVNKILNSDASVKVTSVVSNVNFTYDSSGSGAAR